MLNHRHITRRSVLRGAGVSLCLPWLECFADRARAANSDRKDPPRLIVMAPDSATARHQWYPTSDGSKYELSPTLKHIERHRDQFTVIRGLQHFQGQIAGHDHNIGFLTGHPILSGSGFPNSISMDQVFARYFGNTYVPTLVMSFAGGTGANTLSRNAQGVDIPSISAPAEIFGRLLPPASATEREQLAVRLRQRRSVLDAVGGMLGNVRGGLGYADRQRLDQYADSMREIETRIGKGLNVLADPPRIEQAPDLDSNEARREAAFKDLSLEVWLELMTDLIVLAFQTDMTRIATLVLGDAGGPLWKEYPEWARKHAFDLGNGHDMHHQASKGVDKPNAACNALSERDALYMRCLARMMDKLQALDAHDGNVLDHTQILFGHPQSATHSGVDAQIMVAGGRKLGWKHGLHHIYWQPHKKDRIGGIDVPDGHFPAKSTVSLSNLFLTMLQQAGCPVNSFKESNGNLSELLV